MRRVIVLVFGLSGLAGCSAILGIQSHDLAADAGGTPVGDDSSSGSSGSTSSSDSGGSGMSSGTGSGTSSGGEDAGEDASDASACVTGTAGCNGNVPQVCVMGAWQNQTPCGGTTPVCSNGTCGSFRVTGGIRSAAPALSGDGGIRLVSGGFELGTHSCSEAGVCVTGGIVP
jgi:hypothetical protein